MYKIFTILFAISCGSIIFSVSGCKKEGGCTDFAASNYNPSAQVNDGSCLYQAKAVFYTDVPIFSAATVTVPDLNLGPTYITDYYTFGTPSCGSYNSLGNVTAYMSQSVSNSSYPYSVTLTGSNGWSGSVKFTPNECTPILLQAGAIVFYTTNSSFSNALPIKVTINGFRQDINTISSSAPSYCPANGCANFGFPLGTYPYSATTTSSSGGNWSGSVTISSDGQNKFIKLN